MGARMSKSDRHKIRTILRKEMKKLPSDSQLKNIKNPFAFCFAQAKFDTLMDIDRELKLGAFFKYDNQKD